MPFTYITKQAFIENIKELNIRNLKADGPQELTNLTVLYNYFYVGNPDVSDNEQIVTNRHKAFIDYPCLLGEISFVDGKVQLPGELNQAIDKNFGVANELKSYFDFNEFSTLAKIPPSLKDNIDTKDIITWLKKGILQPHQLPTLLNVKTKFEILFAIADPLNKKLLNEQRYFYTVLAACKNLASSLVSDVTYPNEFHELLNSLIKACANKPRKSHEGESQWCTIATTFSKSLTNFFQLQQTREETNYFSTFKKAFLDYLKSTVLPAGIRKILATLPSVVKTNFNLPFYIENLFPIFVTNLLQNQALDKIIAVFNHWIEPGAQAKLKKFKLVPLDLRWESLVPEKEISVIPAEISEKGWHIVPITSLSQLVAAGGANGFDNCIATFWPQFYSGRMYSFLIYDNQDKIKLGMNYLIDDDATTLNFAGNMIIKKTLQFSNVSTKTTEEKIAEWLQGQIKDHNIVIDFANLENKRIERTKKFISFYENTMLNILYFDPCNETQCEQIKETYCNELKKIGKSLYDNLETTTKNLLSLIDTDIIKWQEDVNRQSLNNLTTNLKAIKSPIFSVPGTPCDNPNETKLEPSQNDFTENQQSL